MNKKFFKEYGIYILLIIIIISFIIIKNVMNNKGDVSYNNDPTQNEVEYNNHDYKKNEYKVINVNETDYMFNYYRDFIYLVLNDREESWKYISDEMKKNIKNYDEYIKYLDEKFIIPNLNKCNIEKYNKSGNTYEIIDTCGYVYSITENNIWDYKVNIKGKN